MSPQNLKSFWLLNIGSFFLFSALAALFSPSLSLFAKSLGASHLDLALIYGLPAGIGLLLRFPSGLLTEIWGSKKLLLMGSLSTFLACMLLCWADSLSHIYLAAFLLGFATVYIPASMTKIHTLGAVEKRSILFGRFLFLSGTGRILAPALAGFLITHLHSFQSVFLICVIFSALSFLCVAFLTNDSLGKGPQSILKQMRQKGGEVFKNTQYLNVGWYRGLQGLLWGVMAAYFPWHAQEVAGLNAAQIGALQSALITCSLFSKGIAGHFMKRIYFERCLLVSTALACLALVGLGLVSTLWVMWVLMICLGAFEGLAYLSALNVLAEYARGREFGSGFGLLGTFADLGQFTGRAVPGLLLFALPFSLPLGFYFVTTGAIGFFLAFGLAGRHVVRFSKKYA